MKANSVDILQDNIKETDEQVNTVTFEYDAKSHHPDNSSWLYYQVQRNTWRWISLCMKLKDNSSLEVEEQITASKSQEHHI